MPDDFRRAEPAAGATGADQGGGGGVSRATLNRWEGGEREPSLSNLALWVFALGGTLNAEWK